MDGIVCFVTFLLFLLYTEKIKIGYKVSEGNSLVHLLVPAPLPKMKGKDFFQNLIIHLGLKCKVYLLCLNGDHLYGRCSHNKSLMLQRAYRLVSAELRAKKALPEE